jgi:hypothetical protein
MKLPPIQRRLSADAGVIAAVGRDLWETLNSKPLTSYHKEGIMPNKDGTGPRGQGQRGRGPGSKQGQGGGRGLGRRSTGGRGSGGGRRSGQRQGQEKNQRNENP